MVSLGGSRAWFGGGVVDRLVSEVYKNTATRERGVYHNLFRNCSVSSILTLCPKYL